MFALAMGRPIWRSLVWLVQKIFLDGIDHRLQDLERNQKDGQASVDSLHEKVDTLTDVVREIAPKSRGSRFPRHGRFGRDMKDAA